MNVELKQKWVTALRSGNYKQGQRRLRTADDEYCCLGVLCDIAGCHWQTDDWGNREAIYGEQRLWGETADCYSLPRLLRADIGILKGQSSHLAEMNDGDPKLGVQPKSFNEIADYIEANL